MEMIKAPKVLWVASWRDIPETDPTQASHRLTRASYFNNENVIYAVKGKATKYDIEHENYHAKKTNEYVQKAKQKDTTKTRQQILDEERQTDFAKPKYGLEDDVAEEFEAHKYAYEKTGKPKHLDHQLVAMYEWLVDIAKPQDKEALYVENKPSEVMRWLHKHLMAVKPPKEWVEDYKELEEWYHGTHTENVDNPSSIYYKDKEYYSDTSKVSYESNFRIKKPKDAKLWWEGKYYQDSSPSIKRQKGQAVSHNSLLPAQLGGKF